MFKLQGLLQKKEDFFLNDVGFLGEYGQGPVMMSSTRGDPGAGRWYHRKEEMLVPVGPGGWSQFAGDN